MPSLNPANLLLPGR
jgi:hypothetical protein